MPSFLVRCFNFAVMPLQVRNSFILFLCAVIWGSAFVAQALGMNHIGPFAFTFARSIIGGLFLLAVLPILDRLTRKKNETQNAPKTSPGETQKSGRAAFSAASYFSFPSLCSSLGFYTQRWGKRVS